MKPAQKTDIVEWLRGVHASRKRLLETDDFECLFEKAADEIERLQSIIKKQMEPKPLEDCHQAYARHERDGLRAEIERLQAKIERWEAQSIAQYAEITRLQKDKTQIAKVAGRLEVEQLTERNVQAEEIERLRAALLHIAEQAGSADEAEVMARRALEPKP